MYLCRSTETARRHQTETRMDVDSTIKSKSTCAATALQRRSRFPYFSSTRYSSPFQLHLKNRQRKIRMVIHCQLPTSSHSRKVCPWYSADDVPANGCRHSPRHSAVRYLLKVLYYQPIQYRISLMQLYYDQFRPTLVVVPHSNTVPNTKILEGCQIRSISISQGIFSQLHALPCHTLSIHIAPASSGCFLGSIPAAAKRFLNTGSVSPISAPMPR